MKSAHFSLPSLLFLFEKSGYVLLICAVHSWPQASRSTAFYKHSGSTSNPQPVLIRSARFRVPRLCFLLQAWAKWIKEEGLRICGLAWKNEIIRGGKKPRQTLKRQKVYFGKAEIPRYNTLASPNHKTNDKHLLSLWLYIYIYILKQTCPSCCDLGLLLPTSMSMCFLIYLKDFNSLQQFYRSLIIQLCRKGKTAIVKVGRNEKECLAGSKSTTKLSPRHSLIPHEWELYSQDTREVKLCLSSGVNWYQTSVCGWGFDLQYVLITAYVEFFFYSKLLFYSLGEFDFFEI